MLLTSQTEAQKQLSVLIETARKIVAFTGAGISTESGVPDFRSPDSPWMRHKPVDFGLFIADPDARSEAWRRKFAMDDLYAGAQPSRGHKALAALVADGKMRTIITQNIDGLHQAAGVPDHAIVELHGNGSYARCLDCEARYELKTIRAQFESQGYVAECTCGGIIKSATISFGQAMPAQLMQRAQEEAEHCDLMLTIGSSLIVYPAANLPKLARHHGAVLVILNREPTPLDNLADYVMRGDIGECLSDFVVKA